MTASNPNNAPPLSGAPSMRISPANIEQVDVLARKLYKRARVNPELEEVANAVRSLHAVLKHLKFETEDPGSLLNVDSSAVYARQLTPILEDSEFALKQLDTILDKKYGRGSDDSADNVSRGMQMDGEKGWTVLESRERDMINLIHTKLTNQKLNIDMFLDTVQLHNPSKSHHLVDTNSANLDSIKDKVDFIASRICQRTNSNLSDGNEEELWEQFRDELEQAGFSKDVLRKNQDVIRAYIRQLDNQLSANGGSTPSVRGLLEYYRPRRDNGIQITPYPTNPTPADFSPEELQPNIDEEKLFPSMRMKRLEDEDDNNNIERQISKPPRMPDYPSNLSYDRHSSSGDGGDGSTALMSTRELMAFDKQSNMALAMENMHLQQPPNPAGSNYHMSISPTLHYLPPSASQPTLPSSAPQAAPDPFGTHLHRPPPLPSAAVSSPPTRRPNSVSVADVSQQQQQALVTSTQRNARLAPDSKGHEIPLDAKWTQISRRLVSPEVLAGAGVRYEARPDFVAVLGELSRDDVTYFAHRTTEVRAARGRRTSNTPTAATVISGDGVKGRKLDDKYHPDKYRNWDVIEAEKRERQRRKEGNKNSRDTDSDDDTDDDGVTFIVNNRSRRRRGSTASTVSALYDSSNDSGSSDGETDSDDRDQESHGSSYSQSYPRSSSYLDDYHHSRSQVHRRSSTMPSTSHKHDDKTLSQAKGRVNSDATDGVDRKNNKDRNERGAKAYPIIVSPPSSTIGKDKGKDKDTGTGTSPAATVKPKPILKNKNDDPHVRIDPHPQIIEEGSSSLPRSLPSYRRSERERRERDKDRDRERSRDRERDRDRDRENDRDRDRDREKRYRSDKHTTGGREKERHTDRDRDRDRDRGDRIREKEYYSNRDRDEGRDEYPHRHRHRSHGHRYHSSSAPRKEREREYYDDHYVSSSNRSREDRTSKKKARDETIRAVGLGGAAAAMLSMLSEATL